MNFVTVTNYHIYHLFLLQIQQIMRMSLFMKFEPLFLHWLKIIGKEHDFLQNCPYILWRIRHETIFNQKQVLQGTVFIIILIASITNDMYTKFYEVWTTILKFLQFLDIQGSIFTCRSDFLHLLLGFSSHQMVIMAWNVDIMFLQYLY